VTDPAFVAPDQPAVTVDALTVRYGALMAVDHLTFRAHRGEVLALLGRNGAGKTSTFAALAGQRSPDGGIVRVLGCDPVADHRSVVARLGVMPQEGGVNPAMRTAEVAHLYAAYYERPRDPDDLLELLGLGEVRATTARHLSGGERQRLSLALALMGRPEVVLLDEPTAGVDIHGRHVIRDVIAEEARAGTCVLLATHELDEAERIAHRVAVIHHGRLVADGTPAELTAGTDSVRFAASEDLDTAGLGDHLGVDVEVEAPGRYRIAAAADARLLAELTGWLATRGLTVHDLRTGPGSLEEAFVHLTGQSAEGSAP
jgi:ABC-2 type transport system ATP-binding protein